MEENLNCLQIDGEARSVDAAISVLRLVKLHTGLNFIVCPIPVKTDVGQVDLVSRLSDGTSEKMTPTIWRLFSMIKMWCFIIFTDLNFVNNDFNVFKNIGFHLSTLSLITTVNQEIFRTYTWSVSFQKFD